MTRMTWAQVGAVRAAESRQSSEASGMSQTEHDCLDVEVEEEWVKDDGYISSWGISLGSLTSYVCCPVCWLPSIILLSAVTLVCRIPSFPPPRFSPKVFFPFVFCLFWKDVLQLLEPMWSAWKYTFPRWPLTCGLRAKEYESPTPFPWVGTAQGVGTVRPALYFRVPLQIRLVLDSGVISQINSCIIYQNNMYIFLKAKNARRGSLIKNKVLKSSLPSWSPKITC